MDQTQIFAALVNQTTAHVRVVGRATFAASPSLREFGEAVVTAPDASFFFYLGDCPLMDSTFLGVMTRFGIAGFNAKRPVQLVNTTAAVQRLLAELGVQRFFTFTQGPVPDLEWQTLYPAADGHRPDLRDGGRTSLEAHRLLVAANRGNATKFQPVIRSLESDLARLDGQAAAAPPDTPAKGNRL